MRARAVAVVVCAAVLVAGCSDDEGGEAEDTTTTTAAEPLHILVTNDDGIGAVGIDVLVNALLEMDDVEVDIVAPAENQSGSSDKTTPGGAPYVDGETASGVEGTAVQGFPADTIAVALDELGLEPDLVVSGVNSGQNVGPYAYASGTVGAARVAVRRGIPAIAGSAGLTEDTLDDYELAAQLMVDHIEERRADWAGSDGGDGVINISVPDCTAGSPRELQRVALGTEVPEGANPFATDCSVEPAVQPTDDVLAMIGGFSALSIVPPEEPAG